MLALTFPARLCCRSRTQDFGRSALGGGSIVKAIRLLAACAVAGTLVVAVASAPADATTGRRFTTAPTPTVSGTARVGVVLTAVPGRWRPRPTQLAYRWYLGSTAVRGATHKTWRVPATAVGKRVRVKVTARRAGYVTTSRNSVAKRVAPGVLSNATPTITGSAIVHGTLTANPGAWSSGTTLHYAWYRNGAAIGASGPTYTTGFADEGANLTVEVSGSKIGYAPRTVSSASVGIAAPSDLLNGEVLTAGKSLRSPSRAYVLVMQGDGNLVEYGPSGALWATGTTGTGSDHVVMQSDGNLVVYSPNSAHWGSGTDGYGAGVWLALQDDGNVVLYRNGAAVWSKAVVRWLVVGARAMSGSTPGTQSMSGPTLHSTQYGVYPPGTKVPVVCGTPSGQGVPGAFTSSNDPTWHRLLGGDWVPDADFYTGTNGLFAGEPNCTPPGGGVGSTKLDAFVAAHPSGSEIDSPWGPQCVTLIVHYLSEVYGVGITQWNASTYQPGESSGNVMAANGWQWHAGKGNFQQGDVLVWSYTPAGGSAGHIAIWYNGQLYEQNAHSSPGISLDPWSYLANYGTFAGYWHHP